MIKDELVGVVAEKAGLNKVLVKKVVEEFLSALREALREGKRIELRNFGVFLVKRQKGKTGRNPRTGEVVPIPERNRVVFRPSKIFKEGPKAGV